MCTPGSSICCIFPMEFFKKIIFKCQKTEEPKEIVFKPFRLLDLPDVVLIQVLQHMSPIQIIELTFCSKRTRLIIQSYVKSIMKHYEVTAKFGGPTNRVRFSSSKNPEIYHKLIMEDSLFARELNMTRRFIANRSVKAVYRETYPGSLITYWMDPIIGAQKFTEYVCATFRCNVTVELGLRENEQCVKCVKFQENASENEILMFLETTRWTKDVIKAAE